MKLFSKAGRLDYFLPRLLILTIVFYYYKVTFWPITYLFVTSYILFLLLFIIRNDWKFRLSGFIKDFLPPLILAGIILVISLVNNIFKHPIQQKDLLLIAVLFSFFYFLYWINVFLKQKIPVKFAVNVVVYTTLVVCCLNILYSISVVRMPIEFLTKIRISDGNTIGFDYNFYCLYILMGLIILNYKRTDNLDNGYSKVWPNLIIILLSLVFILNILLSGSRRGLIVFIILILSYFVVGIVKDRKISRLQFFLRNSLKVIIFIGLIFTFGVLIIPKIPQTKLSIIVFRYSSIIGINDFEYINKSLWVQKNKVPPKIDSLVIKRSYKVYQNYWKSSGSGARFNNIKTDYGDGIRIRVRNKKSEDLRLCFDMPAIIYFANHTYNISFKVKFIKGEDNSINLGWWTDDGNRGNKQTLTSDRANALGNGWYQFNSKYTFIDNHIGIGLFVSNLTSNSEFYITDFAIEDLDFNPEFRKLEFEPKNEYEAINWLNKVNPPINYGLNLINNGDFRYGLKYWTFSADSLSIKVENSDTISYLRITRGNGNGGYYSLIYAGRKIYFLKDCEYQLAFKMKPIYPKKIPFVVGYWLNEGDGIINNLKLDIETLKNGWLSVKANHTFMNTVSNLVFPINSQIDNSQYLITDISLVNMTQPQYNLDPQYQVGDTTKSTMVSGRVSRLKFAERLWKTEYKWYNKLVGHGFKYVELFGKEFLNDPVRGDNPHNPFISILLYSGLIGLIFYCWLLYRAISLYILYRKQYGILFLCFLVTFFFSLFSGNSPFDPTILGFFVILPFFLNHYNKTQVKQDKIDNSI